MVKPENSMASTKVKGSQLNSKSYLDSIKGSNAQNGANESFLPKPQLSAVKTAEF